MRKGADRRRCGALAVVIVLVGAAGVDFGTGIYAEYRLARAVRETAHLGFDPFIAIIGFPLIPQAMRHQYDELEIRATAVEHPVVGKATLEATMHSIDLTDASWLIRPNAKMPVGKLESRIIIDSLHLGRYLGIRDLIVEAPAKDTNNATGGTTESGISGSRGLVFTGTPRAAALRQDGSASPSTCRWPATRRPRWCSPPPTCSPARTPPTSRFPTTSVHAVLAAFAGRLPDQKLPFGGGADQPGRARLRHHHRGHHVGINDHPRRVQPGMTLAMRRCRPDWLGNEGDR